MSDDVLEHLRARLEARGPAGLAIQPGKMQDSPDRAVALLDYDAGPSKDPDGKGRPVLQALAVQVITRGARRDGAAAARRLAGEVHAALIGRHERLPDPAAGPWHYDWIQSIQHPYYLGDDENGRPLVVFNLDIQRWAIEPAPAP